MIWLILKNLRLDEEHVAVGIAAFIKSAIITFAAMLLGLTVDAVTNGFSTPSSLLSYYKAHWLSWTITNIAAPAYRSIDTMRLHINTKEDHV